MMNDSRLLTTRNHSFPDQFSNKKVSPPLESSSPSQFISLASLNIRGLRSSQTKLESLIQDSVAKHISILGLQETHLSDTVGNRLFNSCLSALDLKSSSLFSHWSYHPSDQSGGVGIIIADYVAKYVQKVHRYKGRFIALDLYLPAKKLAIINVYCHPSNSSNASQLNKELYKHIIDYINDVKKRDFKVILMGDLNADLIVYDIAISKGSKLPSHFALVKYLNEHTFAEPQGRQIAS